MNKSIAIIEESEITISNKFGFTKFEYTGEKNDQKIDEKVKHFFTMNSNIEKVIIPVKLGDDDIDEIGLSFGLHIRLSKDLKDKRFIPIIFFSTQSKEEILAQQVNNKKNSLTASILFTEGVLLTNGFDLDQIANDFTEIINEKQYFEKVLPKLIIKNERAIGHQLANEWGVFRLAKFANCPLKTVKLPSDLFFKYTFVKNDFSLQPLGNSIIGLQDKTINALLIDDYAEYGWHEVLDHILKSNFSYHKSKLKKLVTFEEAINFEDFKSQDIIFLDLRLKLEEDKKEETIPLSELSGIQILNKIKEVNRFIQVIILTASNKAWNMAKMMEHGADGYFIKESPEIKVDDIISKANYDNLLVTIDKCLKRKYLKEIYTIWNIAKKTNNQDIKFIHESNPMLDIALNLIKQELLDFGFLTLFQIIELYANNKYDYKDNSIELKGVKSYMIEVDGDNEIWKLTFNSDRINGAYFSSGDKQKSKGVPVNNLYKASCLLKYVYEKNDASLKEFGELNHLRHKIAHEGAKGKATSENIKKVIEIIKIIRQ